MGGGGSEKYQKSVTYYLNGPYCKEQLKKNKTIRRVTSSIGAKFFVLLLPCLFIEIFFNVFLFIVVLVVVLTFQFIFNVVFVVVIVILTSITKIEVIVPKSWTVLYIMNIFHNCEAVQLFRIISSILFSPHRRFRYRSFPCRPVGTLAARNFVDKC